MKLRLMAGALALVLPAIATAAPGIEWTGFGSAYLAKPFTKHARPSVVSDPNLDAAGLSLLGLNAQAQVDNDVTASAQIIARLHDEERGYLNAKWFYLTWTPRTDLHVKAGRQVYPLFMNSEDADVRARLPFTRIPDEVTALGAFQHFDGVSADHTYALPYGLSLKVAMQGGRAIFAPATDGQRYGHDLAGINVGLMGGGWWAVSLHASRVGFTTDSQKPESSLANYTAGLKAERFNVLAQAEYIHQATDKGNGDGGYALVGYKWRGLLPRYSYSFARAKALIQGETMTHDLGVNYEMGPRLVAKLDVQFSEVSKERGGVGITRDDDHKPENVSAALVGVDFLF